jgi:hypothetical protein
MKFFSALAMIILVSAFGATAQTTNILSDAEIEGHNLVRELLAQQPAENSTNSGTLKFKDANGKRVEIPVVFETSVTDTNWSTSYTAGGVSAIIIRSGTGSNEYHLISEQGRDVVLAGNKTMVAFAGSDFWLADLGLEFFHWPQQKVLKKEVRSSRGCAVVESLNPNPATNAYARVLSWIDSENAAIIQAKAYDVNGKLLKEFYPKNVKKVNGQYQLESMEMDNDQTDSRTWLKFDLKPK